MVPKIALIMVLKGALIKDKKSKKCSLIGNTLHTCKLLLTKNFRLFQL